MSKVQGSTTKGNWSKWKAVENEKLRRKKMMITAVKCQICDGKHDLDVRQFYNKISVDDWSSFLKTNMACYGCYEKLTSTHA